MWRTKYFDILNRISVDYQCDRRTGQTHRQTDIITIAIAYV